MLASQQLHSLQAPKKKKRKKEISLCWPRSQFEGEGTYMHKLAPNSQVNPETIDKFARAGLIKNL
jgi:hypothetical protein